MPFEMTNDEARMKDEKETGRSSFVIRHSEIRHSPRARLLQGIVSILAGASLGAPNACAATVASDAASNPAYSAETGGAWKGLTPTADENPLGSDDGGVGFQAWDFAGGFHYPNQSPYGRLNHFIDGVDFAASSFNNLGSPAFGLTNANVAFGGATSSARRAFESPLSVGSTVSLEFDNPLLAPLNQFAPSGFIIRLNAGLGAQAAERFAIFATSNFIGGAWAVSDAAGVSNLSLASMATSQGAEFRFTLAGTESYLFEVRPLNGGNPLATRSGTLAQPGSGAIISLDVVMYDNGSGNGQPGPAAQPTGEREFFFNNLLVTSAGAAGDYDADGDADGADFLLWQRTLGSSSNLAADGNNNGVVDAGDLQVWRQRFGQASAAGSAAAVPEPTTFLLPAILAVGWAIRHRRQRAIRASAAVDGSGTIPMA